jgi:hypothetical protein
LIASDAKVGTSFSPINVLGINSDVGDGAAFLAYETACNTAWCMTVLEEGRFVARFVPAPRRNASEKYTEFRRRFLDFYAQQIERVLTGPPENLAVKNRWITLLRESNWAATSKAAT